jgi:dsRNA-specific ribonuclease
MKLNNSHNNSHSFYIENENDDLNNLNLNLDKIHNLNTLHENINNNTSSATTNDTTTTTTTTNDTTTTTSNDNESNNNKSNDNKSNDERMKEEKEFKEMNEILKLNQAIEKNKNLEKMLVTPPDNFKLNQKLNDLYLSKAFYINDSFLAFIVGNSYWDLSGVYHQFYNQNEEELKEEENKSMNMNNNNNKLMLKTVNYKKIELRKGKREKEHETIRVTDWNRMSIFKQKKILSQSVLAIIGAIYSKCGPEIARQFIEEQIIRETPFEIYMKLIELNEHEQVLEDLVYAQYHRKALRCVTQEQNGLSKCTFYLKNRIIGESTGGAASNTNHSSSLMVDENGFGISESAVKKLAAFDALTRYQSKLPNY